MNLSPERFQEMCVQNDAELKMLYAMRCWVRQEIEFRERLKTEWLRASPLRGRATQAPPEARSGLHHTVSVPDAGRIERGLRRVMRRFPNIMRRLGQ